MGGPVTSYSGGAPSNAAEQGCTCHAPMPDSMVRVTVTGFPATYEPGSTYEVRLSIEGGPPVVSGVSVNQGGLAVQVSAGRLKPGTGTQVDSGTFLTHTTQGNDQRAWTFSWEAPVGGNGNVTAHYAGNAVNGDADNGGGFDRWNKGRLEVGTPAANTTVPPSTSVETEAPGPAFVGVVGVAALVVVWTHRRAR